MAAITFNWPAIVGRELEYVSEALANGHISGGGAFTRRCEVFLQEHTRCRKALLTTSCTHALEMAALLLDIKPGDQVILPSFTFVSTANAFVLRGARPVFADIRCDTLNLDESHLPRLINPKVKAVVVVHYAGVGCEMDTILSLAAAAGLPVIEDNAHGLFGCYRSQPLGSLGTLACLSFHETKNFTCGEGGALLLNDASFVARAEILREKGTNRSMFFRGEVDKYTWVDTGSSYVPSEILAAFLLGQLENWSQVQERRKRIYLRYCDALAAWPKSNGVLLPSVPPHCDSAYHMFWLRLPDFSSRQAFIKYLKDRSIHSVFHYVPLHLSPMGQRYGYRPGDCPITEIVSEQLVRLPFYTTLSEADQDRVIDAILAFER